MSYRNVTTEKLEEIHRSILGQSERTDLAGVVRAEARRTANLYEEVIRCRRAGERLQSDLGLALVEAQRVELDRRLEDVERREWLANHRGVLGPSWQRLSDLAPPAGAWVLVVYPAPLVAPLRPSAGGVIDANRALGHLMAALVNYGMVTDSGPAPPPAAPAPAAQRRWRWVTLITTGEDLMQIQGLPESGAFWCLVPGHLAAGGWTDVVSVAVTTLTPRRTHTEEERQLLEMRLDEIAAARRAEMRDENDEEELNR